MAQLGKRRSRGLIKSGEVLVDLRLGHSGILKDGAKGVKVAKDCPAPATVPIWRSTSPPSAIA